MPIMHFFRLNTDFADDDKIGFIFENKELGRHQGAFLWIVLLSLLGRYFSEDNCLDPNSPIIIPYEKLRKAARINGKKLENSLTIVGKKFNFSWKKVELLLDNSSTKVDKKLYFFYPKFMKIQEKCIQSMKKKLKSATVELDLDLELDLDKEYIYKKENNAKNSEEQDSPKSEPKYQQTISETIDYLNSKTGCSFKPKNKDTQQKIIMAIKSGYTLENFKTIIDKKTKEWMGTDFQKYLRPSTLFQSGKIDSYLNQQERKMKPLERIQLGLPLEETEEGGVV